MSTPVSEACAVTPIAVLPASIDLQFVENLLHVLETTARDGRGRELKDALAEGAAAELIERVTSVVASEGIIHQVQPPHAMRVNVHGDLHGHFFDLRQCILSEGVLEGGKCCVFNGESPQTARHWSATNYNSSVRTTLSRAEAPTEVYM